MERKENLRQGLPTSNEHFHAHRNLGLLTAVLDGCAIEEKRPQGLGYWARHRAELEPPPLASTLARVVSR